MLRPDFRAEIPEEIIKVARAAFPNGNMYLSLRDTLERYSKLRRFKICIQLSGNQRKAQGDWH